jgi:hypothetical protein
LPGFQRTIRAYRDKAPPLGRPLPGDLGKPILNAGAAPNAALEAETQRVAQETEAARISRLFAQTNQQPIPVALGAGRNWADGEPNAGPSSRRRLRAEHAGSQDGVSQRRDRPADGQRRPAAT